MEPVEAIPVANRAALFDTERPGVYCFEEDGHAIWFECPCGCGRHIRLRVYAAGTPKPEPEAGYGAAWEWNENRDHPSLAPSIRHMRGCHFHGHLTNGFWTFEADSGVGA